ncbi:MAG: TIGR02710 family CRISPR-associated protein [Meiothermus sp.]
MSERGFTTLILTVGQTAAPLEHALLEHAPQGAVFIASQSSQVVVAELLRKFGQGLRHHTLLLDDHESLTESYQKSLQALKKALEWESRVLLADITGGTKPMVAGVILALSGRGVTFCYVGGSQRDEHGRVKSGSEQARLLEDPTLRFGLREWEGFRRAWNRNDYSAALDFLQELLSRPLSPSEKRFYTHLVGITEGMMAWDLFRHKAAWQSLKAHLEPALTIAEAWGHGAKVRVLQGLGQSQALLQRILDREDKPTFPLLADLLANAERRAASGRYDDALARLYRAVELAAEADIYERTGIVLRDVRTFEKTLVDLAQRSGKLSGLKEALGLAFELDTRLKNTNTLAQRLYGDYHTELKNPLMRRHNSILAHGTKPVEQADYEALRDYLRGQGLEAAPPWPRW